LDSIAMAALPDKVWILVDVNPVASAENLKSLHYAR
jgi:hypothetical protein